MIKNIINKIKQFKIKGVDVNKNKNKNVTIAIVASILLIMIVVALYLLWDYKKVEGVVLSNTNNPTSGQEQVQVVSENNQMNSNQEPPKASFASVTLFKEAKQKDDTSNTIFIVMLILMSMVLGYVVYKNKDNMV